MNRLRDERIKRGLSLTKLSNLTGIASTDLSAIERGLKPAFPGWQKRIARALKLPKSDLFFRNEDPQR